MSKGGPVAEHASRKTVQLVARLSALKIEHAHLHRMSAAVRLTPVAAPKLSAEASPAETRYSCRSAPKRSLAVLLQSVLDLGDGDGRSEAGGGSASATRWAEPAFSMRVPA